MAIVWDVAYFLEQCPLAIEDAWQQQPDRAVLAFLYPRLVRAWDKLSSDEKEFVEQSMSTKFGQSICIGTVGDNFYYYVSARITLIGDILEINNLSKRRNIIKLVNQICDRVDNASVRLSNGLGRHPIFKNAAYTNAFPSLLPRVKPLPIRPLSKRACEEVKESLEPIAEEPVAEELEVEEPVAEVKVEEPVAEVKVEEPVAEVKVEEPVAEELEVEEPVAEVKVEEPVAEVKVEEPVAEVKVEEPVTEELEVEEPVADEPVTESVNADPYADNLIESLAMYLIESTDEPDDSETFAETFEEKPVVPVEKNDEPIVAETITVSMKIPMFHTYMRHIGNTKRFCINIMPAIQLLMTPQQFTDLQNSFPELEHNGEIGWWRSAISALS